MAVTDRVKLIVWTQAAGICSFPDCRKDLLLEPQPGSTALLGEVAHIVAEKPDGPRGGSPLGIEQRNQPPNLLLLCPDHHKEVDAAPQKYTVERLQEFRRKHHRWVRETLGRRSLPDKPIEPELPITTDTVHSTLLPVLRLPLLVYRAPPSTTEPDQINEKLTWRAPYVLHGGQLLTFENLRRRDNAFSCVTNWRQAEKLSAQDWWSGPDTHRLYVYLLGRCLNKITGSRGLRLDKAHGRFYFAPDNPGEAKKVAYRPLNMAQTQLSVVWQPIQKSRGAPYGYWLHRAVRLRFFHVAHESWVLALRPEFRVTEDGMSDYEASEIGAKVTHKKARMYNKDLLSEVNFWRDYLSDGTPRISYRCGGQSLVIGTTLVQASVAWPGVPGDTVPFRNVQIPETLFSLAEAEQLEEDDYGEEEDWFEELDMGEEDE